MSGRKSSEVLSVLARNKDIIDSFNRNISDSINRAADNIKVIIKQSNNILDNIKSGTLEKGVNIEELPQMFSDIESIFNQIKKNSRFDYDTSHIDKLIQMNKDYDNRLKLQIEEGEKIRKSISSHYQDENYNKAMSVQNEINNIVTGKKQLNNKINKLLSDISVQNSLLNENYNKSKQYIKQASDLEKRAVEKRQNKEEAGKIKKQLNTIFNTINKVTAEKFDNDGYCLLNNYLSSFTNKNDVDVISGYSFTIMKISDYNDMIEKRRIEWEAKKNNAVFSLERVMKKKIDLYITSPYNEEEKMSLFEYSAKFNSIEIESSFSTLRKSIDDLIGKEEFDTAVEKTKELDDLIDNLYNSLLQVDITVKKNYELAKGIFDAMKDLGYTVNIKSKMEGNSPRDGYFVSCSVGDEIIDFDCNVDNEGNIKNEINHITRSGEDAVSCKHSIKDIRNKLVEYGIPVADITKNGCSYVYENQKRERMQGSNERSRG